MPKGKLKLLGDYDGKQVWVSPELPVHTPSGRPIHTLEERGYYLVSEEAGEEFEAMMRSQYAPDVPPDLIDG